MGFIGDGYLFPAGVQITGTTNGKALDLSALTTSSPYFDQYGNIVFPAGTAAGSHFIIKDKNGNNALSVYVDGTKNVQTAGGIQVNGTNAAGRLLDFTPVNTSAPFFDQYGNLRFPNAPASAQFQISDKNGTTILGVDVGGTGNVTPNSLNNNGYYRSGGAQIIQNTWGSVPPNGSGGYKWTYPESCPSGHHWAPAITADVVPGTQYFVSCGNDSATSCTYYQSSSGSLSCWMHIFFQRN